GHIELRREAVDLRRVLELAVEATRPHVTESAHTLTLAVPEVPIPLEADVTRLTQVFVNLLTNAAKYTERGGRIEVTVRLRDDDVTVAVSDNGIGIPAEHLERVFAMFSQVESAMSRSRGGLGIGLSLVKHLVELHGGRVSAHSVGAGKGSTFSVTLSLSRALVAAPAADSARSGTTLDVRASGVSLRILVVEDHRDGAETITELLTRLGHRVQTVHDGGDALQVASDFRPELVLLDIGLPTLSGYEVCRRIRSQAWGTHITIVAMTGWGDAEAQRKARLAGFDRHLVKPVDEDSLLAALALAGSAATARS
ncbi:MAG TPA: ATP-binding protein, partial [Steroidobacteraceae bacterium]|nr:ATP-binding protein [Steroidobacteraceae bacterium]